MIQNVLVIYVKYTQLVLIQYFYQLYRTYYEKIER